MFEPTPRTYTRHDDGKLFRLYSNPNTHKWVLIDEITGEECSTFLLCTHSDVVYKYKDGRTVEVSPRCFLDTLGDMPTHRRYTHETSFKKIK